MEDRTTSKPTTSSGPPLRQSIGTNLAIAFLVLAVIPMSAIAYYNLTQGQSEVAEAAKENLVGLSRSTAHRIEQLLAENQRASATLASQPSVILFLSASGGEREALTSRVYQTLQNFADTHPDYDAPGLLDVDGIVVASLADTLVGKDRSFRDYFQASIQGQPYVSDILVGRATGRPGVFLTNPVVTAEGEIVGIDIVWLKADTVWSIVDDVVVGEESVAYLVDQDGVIIAHPDRDLLYHSLGELTPAAAATISATIRFGTVEGTDTPLIPASLGLDDLAAELAPPPQSPPIPGGKCGTYRYYSPLDHRDHVVGYTRLEAHPWTVVVDLPETQFLAPLQRLGSVAWVSVGLVGVLALIISVLLARSITRPIRRLTDAALAVEQGWPFEPADIADVISGRDEIAHLGRVFSNMVLGLRQREERIEHLNLVLRAVRNVNQLITREKDRDRLLKSACENLIETRGYYSAWIALLDESHRLVTAAEAGWGEDFLPLIEQLKRGELTARCRKALKQADVVATQDQLSACAGCPLAEKYADRDAVTVRLEYGGKVYGLMSVSIPADFTADEEEQALFEEVAGDIAFALRNIEMEEEHKRAEERFRIAAEVASDLIYEWDVTTNHLKWFGDIDRVLGYKPDEFPHSIEAWAKIIHPDDQARLAGSVERHRRSTEHIYEEYRIQHQDGNWLYWIDHGAPVLDGEGRPYKWIGVCTDITARVRSEEERARAEKALQEYSERLEEMVEQRTQELRAAQEQLVRQEKLATLGQLAGGVGHELRNPLGVISNAIYFLQMTLPDAGETTSEYLSIISSEVRGAEKIVSDLLDFSRTKLPDREEITVSELVARALAKRPPPENVKVATQIPADLPPVYVDPWQIGQVLDNLVTNGYQAMPEGGRLIIAAMVSGDQSSISNLQSLISISITDTGCGISEEHKAKLFEPLFTTKARGIGLGLAVSKNLVEANGGSIEVESEVRKGSAFTVRLPTGEREVEGERKQR